MLHYYTHRRLTPVLHKGVYAPCWHETLKASTIKKRKNQRSLAAPFFLFHIARPKGRSTITMVRLFTALCKSLIENLSEKIIFDEATGKYCYQDEACPHCGAIGKFSSYGKYSRGLFYHKDGKNIDSRVWVLRFECKSCGSTHALLPDVFTPYSPYSLSFVLTVLLAYFERETTVVNICEQFGIAISTLYEWKKRIASHKALMIGVLKSRSTPTLEFLRNLFESDRMSGSLRRFFGKYGFSFMQERSTVATRSHSP